MTYTYEQALGLAGVTVPAHLVAAAEVPVLTGVQAQGDLLVLPAAAPVVTSWHAVPVEGIRVVLGEATGHTHWLHRGFASPGVCWAAEPEWSHVSRLGFVHVPDGQSAMLVHTDEHGANGIGPGTFAVHRKREAGADGDDRQVED